MHLVRGANPKHAMHRVWVCVQTLGSSVQAGGKVQQPQRRHYLVQQQRQRRQQYCPWQRQACNA
jgi:hypothetical protein